MSENPWYSFYVGDYDRKTSHLSMLEHGAYRLLLDHYYAMREPLPADLKVLYRICRAFTPSERKSVVKILSIYFTKHDAHYHNKKCDSEINKLLKYSNRQSAAAKLRHSYDKIDKNDDLHQKSIKNQPNLFHESHRSDSNNNLNYNNSQSATAQPRARVPQPEPQEEDDVVVTRTREENPFTRIYDFGSKMIPGLAIKNTSEITKWVDAGYDVALDILPIIRRFEGRNIAAWKYFTQMIVDAHTERMKPLPQPTKGKQNGKFDNRDPATRARDIGEEIIRKRRAEWERADRAAGLATIPDQTKPGGD